MGRAAGKRRQKVEEVPRRSRLRRGDMVSDSEEEEEEEEMKRPAPTEEYVEPQYEPYVDNSNSQDPNDLAMCHTISEEFSCEDPNTLKHINPPKEVSKMDQETKESMEGRIVRFLVYKGSTRMAFKLADISKEVFPEYKGIARYYLVRGNMILRQVFGYRVVALDKELGSKKEAFFVINSIDAPGHLKNLQSSASAPRNAFLMAVLGIIWCFPGRKVSEAHLWKHLTQMDASVHEKQTHHRQLGDVSQLIKQLELQLYLSSTQVINADGGREKTYEYGPRALLEIGLPQILYSVQKLIHKTPPNDLLMSELRREMVMMRAQNAA